MTLLRRRLRFALAALSIVALVACGASTTATPAPPTTPLPLTGLWVGAATDSGLGVGSIIRATLSQSGVQLTGTWESSFPIITEDNDNSGTVSGSVDGSAVSVVLTFSGAPGDCSFAVKATLNAGATQMLGTYTTVSCTIAGGGLATSGSITFTKQ